MSHCEPGATVTKRPWSRYASSSMRLIVAVLAALFILLGAAAPSIPPGEASHSVAVTDDGAHLFVWLRLNGSEPLHFAVDTAGGEMIDSTVAARLQLGLRGEVSLTGIGAGSERGRWTRVGEVQIGTVKLRNVGFIVLPIATSFGVAEGTRIDGIIGPALLSRFTVTIDPAAGTMTLDPPASGPLGEIPMASYGGGHPTTACTVAGVATRCTLDTGSRLNVTLLRPFLENHPAIAARATTAEGVEGYGIGGTARGRLGEIPIGLAGRELTVVADFTSQRVGAFASRSVGANVGEGVLRRFAITYDAARGRVRIVPTAAFGEPDRVDRSGLFLVRRDGATIVLDVRPETPAAKAGLRAGDEVVTVDASPAGTLDLNAIRSLLRDPAVTHVVLGVRGDEGIREIDLGLADYVAPRALKEPPAAVRAGGVEKRLSFSNL